MMSPVTRPPTGTPPQRVCPHCGRIAHTDDRRCPFCGRGYRRRLLPSIALLLVVFAVGILGGMAAMFVAVGNRVEDEVDSRVTTVQRDLERSVRRAGDDIGDDLGDQLDERLRANGLQTP
jgi:hypothetical protein